MRLTIVHLHTLGAGSGFTHSSFWEPVLSKMWTLLVPPFGNAANAILYPSNQQFPYTFFVLGWGYLTTHHNQNSFSTYDELFGPNWQSSGDDLFRNERWHILWICPELIRAQTRLNLLVTTRLFHYHRVLTPILKTCFGLDTEQTYKKGSWHSFHSEAIWRWWW